MKINVCLFVFIFSFVNDNFFSLYIIFLYTYICLKRNSIFSPSLLYSKQDITSNYKAYIGCFKGEQCLKAIVPVRPHINTF